jgi:hypothetical protein
LHQEELGEGSDLVVIAFAAASDVYSGLAKAMVKAISHPDTKLVLPAAGPKDTDGGMPNRIVALLPHGRGEDAARSATVQAKDTWEDWIRETWLPDAPPVLSTPGFPLIHWVCVSASVPGGYTEQWKQAQRLLAARRRVRDFPAIPEADWRERELCSLTPRWPAERTTPRHAPGYEKQTKLSTVGWVKRSWQRINKLDGFPSTSSIASAPYRAAVLARLDEDDVRVEVEALQEAEAAIRSELGIHGHENPVPGLPARGDPLGRWLVQDAGPWVYKERWRSDALARENTSRESRADLAARATAITTAVDKGRDAAERLSKLMAPKNRDPEAVNRISLTSYLAVVVQDLDGMGAFLSGKRARNTADEEISIAVTPGEHTRIATELLQVSGKQKGELRSPELLSQPVYVGGDDLLAFTPAAKAIKAAVACHDLVPKGLPRPSTAILFFHYIDSIQQAISEARRLLDLGKERVVPHKHALAVGYLRRSGATEVSIQPWSISDERSSAELFGLFSRDATQRLSPRLVNDLDRDAAELDGLLHASREYLQREIARLVQRHLEGDGKTGAVKSAAGEIAEALVRLGERECSSQQAGLAVKVRPQPAARVGVFLRQEAR